MTGLARMSKSTRRALACMPLLLIAGIGPPTARADVTAVSGSAFGYSSSISLFVPPPSVSGPAPTVTLPAGGSAVPITANAPSGSSVIGPGTFFSSGPLTVSTQGITGPSGFVTSSASIQSVGTSGSEPFTAANVASTCTAAQAVTASATITGGALLTDNGLDLNDDADYTDAGEHPPVSISVPVNPSPNSLYTGHVHLGPGSTDDFQYIFNEQVMNPDGSITVNAAHEVFLGPTAAGHLYVGRVRCGITGLPADLPAPGPGLAAGGGGGNPAAGPTGQRAAALAKCKKKKGKARKKCKKKARTLPV